MATTERYLMETMLKIVDKNGEEVPFALNKAQADFDARLTGHDIVPKSRQRGISSYVLGRFTIKSLAYKNQRSVIIAHDSESTQKMLAKIHYFINHMEPKPVIGTANKNEITFPKTGSTIYIGTAGARRFGRGDTINNLHCSEVAFWPDPGSIVTGLFQAVPHKTGEVILESTGFGQGNYYHRRCMRAAAGLGRYRLHFFGWLDDPDCFVEPSKEQEHELLHSLDEEELNLIRNHEAKLGNILFRREKIYDEFDGDEKKFLQEYPTVLNDCFQATGYSLFPIVKFRESKDNWIRESRFVHRLRGHPHSNKTYAVAADVGGGVGRDRSVVEVVCLEDDEQVYEYICDSIEPDSLAYVIKDVGNLFGEAYVGVESNNHGIATLAQLRKIYPSHKIHHEPRNPDDIRDGKPIHLTEFGVRTTPTSKPLLISGLRKALKTLIIHSPVLQSELATFVEKENGQLEAEEGNFDDTVMAMAVMERIRPKAAMFSVDRFAESKPKGPDPFGLEAIMDEVRGRRSGFPISSQEAWGDEIPGILH